jgi:transcriptional regulator with XRE-family HTH domain
MDIFDLTGPKLRELRDGLDMSRERMSELAGLQGINLPVRTIQDVENGVSDNPGLNTIKAMVRVLGLTVQVGEMAPKDPVAEELQIIKAMIQKQSGSAANPKDARDAVKWRALVAAFGPKNRDLVEKLSSAKDGHIWKMRGLFELDDLSEHLDPEAADEPASAELGRQPLPEMPAISSAGRKKKAP